MRLVEKRITSLFQKFQLFIYTLSHSYDPQNFFFQNLRLISNHLAYFTTPPPFFRSLAYYSHSLLLYKYVSLSFKLKHFHSSFTAPDNNIFHSALNNMFPSSPLFSYSI